MKNWNLKNTLSWITYSTVIVKIISPFIDTRKFWPLLCFTAKLNKFQFFFQRNIWYNYFLRYIDPYNYWRLDTNQYHNPKPITVVYLNGAFWIFIASYTLEGATCSEIIKTNCRTQWGYPSPVWPSHRRHGETISTYTYVCTCLLFPIDLNSFC